MKLSIVIPAYHEEKNIAKVLDEVSKKVKTDHETLIVYDYEEDPTKKAVLDYLSEKKERSVRPVKNSVGTGRGALNAIKTGFKESKGEAVIVVMADLSDDIARIDQMYRLIENGSDIVCGSRYMKGGKQVGGPVIKSLLSRTAGLTLHYFFRLPTHDATNAFKTYRKSMLNNIKIESTGGFEYSLEIIIKAFKKGYKITEIPTVWTDREARKSNFKLLRWLPNYLKWYVSLLKKGD